MSLISLSGKARRSHEDPVRTKRWLVGNVQGSSEPNRFCRPFISIAPSLPPPYGRFVSVYAPPIATRLIARISVIPRGSEVMTEVNGDPVIFPEDLLPFINHTTVSPPGPQVPLFLFETPHYSWINSACMSVPTFWMWAP